MEEVLESVRLKPTFKDITIIGDEKKVTDSKGAEELTSNFYHYAKMMSHICKRYSK